MSKKPKIISNSIFFDLLSLALITATIADKELRNEVIKKMFTSKPSVPVEDLKPVSPITYKVSVLSFTNFLSELGKIADESKFLIRIKQDFIYIESDKFTHQDISRIGRLITSYAACRACIVKSETIVDGMMYEIEILEIL